MTFETDELVKKYREVYIQALKWVLEEGEPRCINKKQ